MSSECRHATRNCRKRSKTIKNDQKPSKTIKNDQNVIKDPECHQNVIRMSSKHHQKVMSGSGQKWPSIKTSSEVPSPAGGK
jgi:hypothetical protein